MPWQNLKNCLSLYTQLCCGFANASCMCMCSFHSPACQYGRVSLGNICFVQPVDSDSHKCLVHLDQQSAVVHTVSTSDSSALSSHMFSLYLLFYSVCALFLDGTFLNGCNPLTKFMKAGLSTFLKGCKSPAIYCTTNCPRLTGRWQRSRYCMQLMGFGLRISLGCLLIFFICQLIPWKADWVLQYNVPFQISWRCDWFSFWKPVGKVCTEM